MRDQWNVTWTKGNGGGTKVMRGANSLLEVTLDIFKQREHAGSKINCFMQAPSGD